ncbi:MAG: cupin [Erythrobacter sp.]
MNSDPKISATKLLRSYPLGQFFAQLTQGDRCQAVEVDQDFWRTGIANLPPGRLVSLIESAEDWPSWERHPNGEEFILQLSGELELVLEQDDIRHCLPLQANEFVIVPKCVWHTANVIESGSALYITPGDGTENRLRE